MWSAERAPGRDRDNLQGILLTDRKANNYARAERLLVNVEWRDNLPVEVQEQPYAMALAETRSNSQAAARRLPDRLWFSTAAGWAIVDAKAPGSNVPIYPDGIDGLISGLRPVYVPALDDTEADVLVGPSSGFRWAEDGTYTLTAVRPAQAGQDIGLAGIVWLAPIHGGAFTRYELATY